jgi:hypothetical protein
VDAHADDELGQMIRHRAFAIGYRAYEKCSFTNGEVLRDNHSVTSHTIASYSLGYIAAWAAVTTAVVAKDCHVDARAKTGEERCGATNGSRGSSPSRKCVVHHIYFKML